MQSKSSPTDPKKGNEADKAKAQAQMKKKTPEELLELANKKTFSTESLDEPVPVSQRPSETNLQNSELKKVPLVKAFNSAENHQEQTKKEEKK
ncbi:unnamed protein product [Caenorhabditis sp. 36 PRJEB53466]|nr:unnamed protein product [Caenorhabditis sp. 36 PRJEB53466]